MPNYRADMNVNLGPILDRFVTGLVRSGLYQSQSEVLREGLRLLKEKEDFRETRLAELRRQIAVGIEEADRGEFVPGDSVFAELRKRSAARRRGRKPHAPPARPKR
jgi:antitoxin ParD1/3/4